MRFLILRENGFTTFMSCIGVISGALAIPFWFGVFDKDYLCLGPAIVSTIICIAFYTVAFISFRKAVKSVRSWKRNTGLTIRNFITNDILNWHRVK